MRKLITGILVLLICSGSWLQPPGVAASPQPQRTGPVAGSIRCPDNYEPVHLGSDVSTASGTASSGLKAVAIVGEVGSNTNRFIEDMEEAVDTLQAHGVSVTAFYYGVTSFTWGDIVAAAQGAHFLLYMGHGVDWTAWPEEDDWGGFYLGNHQFVRPSDVRSDLDGVLAPDSIVIFSYACYTAGTAYEGVVVSQDIAERRVRSYAAAFIDIGMEAYFANNYPGSAATTVDLVLDGNTMADVFRGGVNYNSSGLVKLTHPEPGYDLWLDKCMAEQDWHLAFVGMPEYVFQTVCPWPDFDCSGSVDATDVQAVADAWRCADGQGCYQTVFDRDGDGFITIVDITSVAAAW